MRDQYASDVSDVLKFALLRALAGSDRTLGIAWYYAPGDDGKPTVATWSGRMSQLGGIWTRWFTQD